jgi:hypothetical protein
MMHPAHFETTGAFRCCWQVARQQAAWAAHRSPHHPVWRDHSTHTCLYRDLLQLHHCELVQVGHSEGHSPQRNQLMVSDKDLTKLTLPQLQKMAKQIGVKNYSSYRTAGLIDRLSKDNSMQFTVPKKGGARVGQKRGARLAFDKKPKKK